MNDGMCKELSHIVDCFRLQVGASVPDDELGVLEKLSEFRRTFQEKFRRSMTEEESLTLNTAEKIIRDRLERKTAPVVGDLEPSIRPSALPETA
jgi:hypothetical protein